MSGRGILVALVLAALALFVWRSQLFTVSRPGEHARPLVARSAAERRMSDLDVVLPAVPIGMEHVRRGEGVLLVHYWAPWERHGLAQISALDSLRRAPEMETVRVVVVCFDPFPSVARYVGRHRLRLSVLLDLQRQMREALPCPSVPFTYVLDREGRIAILQSGEVDWWSPGTRSTLRALAEEPAPDSAATQTAAPI